MEKITCTKCGDIKDATKANFYWRNDSKKWRSVCRECVLLSKKNDYKKRSKIVKQRVSEYRKRNHDKIVIGMREYNTRPEVKKRMRQYRVDNRKLLRQKEKEWRKNNPEKAREIAKRKHQKRMQNPLVRIRYNVSRGINTALHRQGSSKAGESIMKYLDFSIEELKLHLEKLFEPWMNWNNYGKYTKDWKQEDPKTWKWQIDHVIPQSEFEYDSMDHPEFKKCWALNNLRPYSSKRNCIDGCNRIRHRIINESKDTAIFVR